MSSDTKLRSPSDAEDKAITEQAITDGTHLSDVQLQAMKPLADVLPELAQASEQGKLELKKMGRPKADVTKERVTIRLSPEVTDFFRSQGRGWQTRLDEALKEYVREHSDHS